MLPALRRPGLAAVPDAELELAPLAEGEVLRVERFHRCPAGKPAEHAVRLPLAAVAVAMPEPRATASTVRPISPGIPPGTSSSQMAIRETPAF